MFKRKFLRSPVVYLHIECEQIYTGGSLRSRDKILGKKEK